MTTHPPERSAQRNRILSPDIARGIALLGIALANVATAWLPADSSLEANRLGGMITGSAWEQIAVVFSAMFIHVRGLPMFSTMLGYGVGMIVGSLWRRGYPENQARRVLVRRYGFLALFGLVHMVFLFWGDIMFFYGVAGMIFAAMMTLRDKSLWWFAGVLFAVYAIGTVLISVAVPMMMGDGAASEFTAVTQSPESYGGYLLFALLMVVGQVVAIPVEILMLMPVMIIGFIAARHRVLSRVDEFRRQLWAAVWVMLAVVVLVGLPWGLAEIGVLPTSWAPMFSGLNQAFGVLTGPGIVAAVALLAQPLQRRLNEQAAQGESTQGKTTQGEAIRLPLLPRMVAALGARSMSGYVFQSFLLLIITQPFTLGLGIGQGILGASAVAAGVWLITMFLAFALELAGRRGPFEAVHRRISYGKNGLQDPYVDPQSSSYADIPGARPLGSNIYDNDGDPDRR